MTCRLPPPGFCIPGSFLWRGGTHQVAEVAERVPGQLHDALREPPLVADEAGDDCGQSVPGPVQHDGGGGSPHSDFGAVGP